jgi:hypothetical protein
MHLSTLLFLTAFIVAIPSAAFATPGCPCSTGGDPLGIEAKGVPTNVKLFVPAGTDRATLSLAKVVNGMSQPVPSHFEDTPESTGDGWIVPDAPLDPMASYEYVKGDIRDPFTTGPGDDTAAPTFTTAAFVAEAMAGACEQHIAATLRTEGGADDSTEQSRWTWKVTITSPAKTLYFPPGTDGYLGRMDTDDSSWTSCLNNFPAAELDKTFEAKLVALDWAGNASKEATTSFEFAEASGGCGCRMAESAKSTEMSAFLFGALALLACRRRKQ